jgi:hypothetical protein
MTRARVVSRLITTPPNIYATDDEVNSTLESYKLKTDGYSYRETIYFTSSGTFTKASYPWLRAIRVKCQGAGGAGGGASTTSAGQASVASSGGSGAYAESFITDISGLGSSITVTVGSGGTGVAGGAGNTGGDSSFGSLVIAKGGPGCNFSVAAVPSFPANWNLGVPTSGGSASSSTGDLKIDGSSSSPAPIGLTFGNVFSQPGTPSMLANAATPANSTTGINGNAGLSYGGGGTGGVNYQNQATARSGGSGGAGIVIVELYA